MIIFSFIVTKTSKDKDVFDFKLFAKLDAFCLSVCDEKNSIAEIKIQGNGGNKWKFLLIYIMSESYSLVNELG